MDYRSVLAPLAPVEIVSVVNISPECPLHAMKCAIRSRTRLIVNQASGRKITEPDTRPIMDVGRQFEPAVKKVGISNFRFHDLRHTAATRMAANGVDPFTLAYIFGWSDIRMAMRYTHSTNATMKQAVRSLDSLSARLGNVLATKTRTAGAAPP